MNKALQDHYIEVWSGKVDLNSQHQSIMDMIHDTPAIDATAVMRQVEIDNKSPADVVRELMEQA